MDAARAACPLVWLQDDNTNTSDYSCGVTRTFGGTNTNANKIVAKPPQFEPPPLAGGTGVRFQFRFRTPGESVCACTSTADQSNTLLELEQYRWRSAGLQQDLRGGCAREQGRWRYLVCGQPKPCLLPSTDHGMGPYVHRYHRLHERGRWRSQQHGNGEDGGALTMYPNPNRGDLVTIALSEVGADVRTVSVDIYDLRGQRVTAEPSPYRTVTSTQ